MAEEKKKDIYNEKHRYPLLCSTRFALAFIAFLGFTNMYALRLNMSVAIVCMVNHSAISDTKYTLEGANITTTQKADDSKCMNSLNGNSTNIRDGEFEWNKELQGIILGSLFWGYVITQFPGGWLATKLGGKRVLGYAMLMAAIATLLTPVGSRISPYFLIVLRFLCGLGQGVVFPAMLTIWSNWAPPLERSILVGFTHAGVPMGNVVVFPISGLLCEYGFAGGWPSIFYVFGSLGVIWFVAWMVLVTDTPSENRHISPDEREYIDTTVGMAVEGEAKKKELGTPWKAMLTSVPVWALIISHTCANWGLYVLNTNMPTYMKEVLKFDIKSNGALSAVPYLAFWACLNIAANFADFMRSRGVRTGVMRKIVMAIGTLCPALFLVATGFVPCSNPYLAVALLTLTAGFIGFQFSGCFVNQMDIAPPFAGLIFGVSNTAASLPGFLVPLTIGMLTTNQTQEEWRVVFYITAAIYVVSCTAFLFSSGEVQAWAKPYMDDKHPKEETKALNPAMAKKAEAEHGSQVDHDVERDPCIKPK